MCDGERLTGSFDLFLGRLVSHMCQTEDSIVILILTKHKQYILTYSF